MIIDSEAIVKVDYGFGEIEVDRVKDFKSIKELRKILKKNFKSYSETSKKYGKIVLYVFFQVLLKHGEIEWFMEKRDLKEFLVR